MAAGKVLVAGLMLSTVWQIGAKVEKLKGGQHPGQHPEQNQVFSGDEQLKQVEGDGHQQYLPYTDVLLEKAEIPGEKAAMMIIRVFVRGNKAVMLVVLGEELAVKVIGEKERSNVPEGGIDLAIF